MAGRTQAGATPAAVDELPRCGRTAVVTEPPTGPDPRPRRRASGWLRGAAIAVTLGFALHALAWRTAADRLDAGFVAWSAAQRTAGWRVDHQPTRPGGWPFAAVLHLPGLVIGRDLAAPAGALEWRAETASLRVAPLWADRLTVEAGGRGAVRFGALTIPLAADRLEVALPLRAGPVPRAGRLVAERLRLGTPIGGVELRALIAELETMRTATETEDAMSLGFTATGIAVPPAFAAAAGVLGREVAEFTGAVALSGPWPRGPDAAAQGAAWRDGGGSLQARGLNLVWGRLRVTAEATLTLDEALQPMGAGTLRVIGGGAAIDAASASGWLPAGGTAAAWLLLHTLERTPEGDGVPEVVLPATLTGRTLSVARIPLARSPAWVWPGAAGMGMR